MKYIILAFFLLNFLIPMEAFSEIKVASKKNCFIQIVSTYKTGVVKKRMRDFKLDSKAKCENVRALYSQNFSPKEIIKVEAKMEWVE